ncbi:hypothetical protein EVAR_92047_1 [Eumeta japonica]|uniref:Uncharacterized protein n=1 Tax=Eumeta variegata TaxID=151549 RepID=A0A4C1SYX8_EUMVA|nr:hypothetical protein EVAR_92047_1 [Eumeta japonica]
MQRHASDEVTTSVSVDSFSTIDTLVDVTASMFLRMCSISVNPLESIFNSLDDDSYLKKRFKGQRWVACCMLLHVAGMRPYVCSLFETYMWEHQRQREKAIYRFFFFDTDIRTGFVRIGYVEGGGVEIDFGTAIRIKSVTGVGIANSTGTGTKSGKKIEMDSEIGEHKRQSVILFAGNRIPGVRCQSQTIPPELTPIAISSGEADRPGSAAAVRSESDLVYIKRRSAGRI